MCMPKSIISASGIPHYDEMRHHVFRAAQQRARARQPAKAAEIAKYCFTAKMAEIYADELLKINMMVSDSIEPKTEPANSARNYPSTVRKDIIDGRAALREKRGDPARGCIFKAGGDQNEVNAEVPQ